VAEGVADPARICVVGGSHGGFLGAHLIGQAPDMFKCAAGAYTPPLFSQRKRCLWDRGCS